MKTVVMRIVSLLFVLFLLSFLLLAPAAAETFTSGDYKYIRNENGYMIIVGCVNDGPVLTIPDSLDGHTVTGIGDRAFKNNASLTNVVLPDTLQTIGLMSFSDCSSLASIYFPQNLQSIGTAAFAFCSSLTDVALPEGLQSIGDKAFSYCVSLQNLTLPDSVQSIGEYAFSFCPLQSPEIILPMLIRQLGYNPFVGVENLVSINVPSDHETFQSIDGVLINKQDKAIISYPMGKMETQYWVPEDIMIIGDSAFYGNTVLHDIILPASVQFIDSWALSDCSSLRSINLPDGLQSIGEYAFLNCASLTTINIPNGLQSIGEGAFSDCPSLASLNLPASIQFIGNDAFSNNEAITLIVPQGSYAHQYAKDNGIAFIFADGSSK